MSGWGIPVLDVCEGMTLTREGGWRVYAVEHIPCYPRITVILHVEGVRTGRQRTMTFSDRQKVMVAA